MYTSLTSDGNGGVAGSSAPLPERGGACGLVSDQSGCNA